MTKPTTDDAVEDEEADILENGELVITMDGEGSIGKAAVFEGNYRAVTDTHVGRARTNSVETSLAIACFLNSSLGQAQIEQCTSGSTGQTQVSANDLLTIAVPAGLVPLSEEIAADYRATLRSFETTTTSVRRQICYFSEVLSRMLIDSGTLTTECNAFFHRHASTEQLFALLRQLKPSMF